MSATFQVAGSVPQDSKVQTGTTGISGAIPRLLNASDAAKMSIPVFIALVTGIVTAVSSLVIVIVTHILTNRAKVIDVKVKEGYSLAHKIAVLVDKTHSGYAYFDGIYETNYGHMDDLDKAVENFVKQKELFQGDHEALKAHDNDCKELRRIIAGAWVYLPENAIHPVNEYLEAGEFTYLSDALGMNEYCNGFFKNLRDKDKQRRRKEACEKIVKAYSKLKL